MAPTDVTSATAAAATSSPGVKVGEPSAARNVAAVRVDDDDDDDGLVLHPGPSVSLKLCLSVVDVYFCVLFAYYRS